MKVLFINTVYGRGSTGRIVADLGRMLEENGHTYKVAYGRGDHRDDPHCYRVGNDADLYLHAGLSRLTDRAGFYSAAATERLIGFIRAYGPDIIHLHNLHGYYLNLTLLFGYLADEYRGRVLWTLHDCWPLTGHCVHFTYVGCDKWKSGCSHCPQRGEYPASLLCDCSARNYAEKARLFTGVKNLEIITVSQWLKGIVQQSFLKDASVTCIYNGVDTARFHRVPNRVKAELGLENKKLILLVSDGWNERKGYATALGAAAAAPADWQFVIVGLTKKQIRALPPNVTGFERIWSQDRLIEFYSAADVFFNPSLEETFGLVTAEAMACGTPAVVMNATACPELITDSSCGVVLDRRPTTEALLAALEKGMRAGSAESFPFPAERFLAGYKSKYHI